ncbi:MAG: hypothetical protein JWR80_2909 [Bradyrhizobium sp.]|nr:hypothetical protein [Bradyrhizobium sp.]
MIVAVPILIAVSLFLGWCLVKLTVHALPLFAAVMTTSLLSRAGLTVGPAIASGALCALLIVLGGKALAAPSNAPALRAGVLLFFAAPASFAAYHAVLGLTAIVMASDASRTIWAMVAALIVGAAAWREVAMSTDRGLAV